MVKKSGFESSCLELHSDFTLKCDEGVCTFAVADGETTTKKNSYVYIYTGRKMIGGIKIK